MEIVDRSTLLDYRNMLEQIKNREISASDGASQYASIATELQKSHGVFRGIDPGSATIYNGVSLLDPDTFNQARQYVSGQMSPQEIVDQYHQRGGNHNGVGRLVTFGIGGSKHLSQIEYERTINPHIVDNNPIHQYNVEAADFIKKYAATHDEAWKQAAGELNIKASKETGSYYTHFYERPKDVEYNFGEGEVKSEAEIIFRHIASDSDIAQFEEMMRPAQEELDNFAYNLLDGIATQSLAGYEGTTNTEFTLLKIAEMMQAEGIDISQLQRLSFGRNDDNSFYAKGEIPNKTAIEEAINNNQEIYDLLSGIWQG
ncbi:hypothetical protein [Terasakiella sp.]|uniref:hypothetical protein n=1 Tax=Terasakiella sp. TaxID=2034861 RepID=UPI003AA8541B